MEENAKTNVPVSGRAPRGAKIENIGAGWLYFYIHFATEVICFFLLTSFAGDKPALWAVTLAYDMLAFVPQSLVGAFADRHRRFPLTASGLLLMCAAAAPFLLRLPAPAWLIPLCLGNCFTHVGGAEVTLNVSRGRLSHSAIFVSGGSFGVITGKLRASRAALWPVPVALALAAVPLAFAAEKYRTKSGADPERPCAGFSYHNKNIPKLAVIVIAVFIVIVRGYMGYGIPTTWNKSTLQTVALFFTMGAGKALGGVFSDLFGLRRTALFSVVAACPFLLFGDNVMAVSLAGVALFSMTMSVTLALLVSVLPSAPGLAFGLTTIGLFIGTAPIFFFKLTTLTANCVMIAAATALCAAGFLLITGKEKKHDLL